MPRSLLYQELDQAKKETRLIVIGPGFEQDDIRCTMQTMSLLEKPLPKYETISYVRGNAALRGTVYLNDHKLDVPLSTEVVLRRMRDPQWQRTVWIDSICIDQTNMDDRNYQVQLMCDIYSSTASGLIWLGEDKGSAKEIFESVRALYEEARRETDNFRYFKETVWPGSFDTYRPPSAVHFDTEQFARFFDLPWFSRLWVVQEAALASRSICHLGSYTIPLCLIQRVALWLYSQSKSSQSALSGHTGLARAVHLASYTDELFEKPFRTENNLLWMLNTLKQYDTSRGEDHVYGLVGMYQRFLLQHQMLPQRLVPDYGQTLSYVLCNAAKLAIEELRRLDPLLYICHRTTDELEHDPLPTWVPKWHRKQDLYVDHFPLNYNKFRASEEYEAVVKPSGMGSLESLIVDGFSLANVLDVTEAFSQNDLYAGDRLLSLLESVQRLAAGVIIMPGQVEHTLVASLDHRMKPMSREQSMKGHCALCKHLPGKNTALSFEGHEDNAEANAARAYHEALMRWMRNRRFFVTELGHIGTAPQVVQRGDQVTILYGSGMPIILRPLRQTGSFAVIGQAYVFANMLGEAVEAHKKIGSKDVSFTLA